MKIIPVIDILNKTVVHAVKGQRHNYQPLESILFKSTEPLEVAKGFKALGFNELYVADLDAIIDCSTDFRALKSIADETGLKLMVDAGVTSIERAQKLFEIGSFESLLSEQKPCRAKNLLHKLLRFLEADRVVVSLDLKGDKVLVKLGFDGCLNPICLTARF